MPNLVSRWEGCVQMLTFEKLLLVVAIAWPAMADEWTKTFPMSGTPELRVRADDASVTVRPWDRNEIEARVTTSGWKISDSEVKVVEKHSANSLDVEVRVPRMNWTFGGFGSSLGHRWIKLELRVPSELRSDIHTGDGHISVERIKGNTVLSSGDGKIEAEGLDGRLNVRTGDGHIRVRGRFDVLEARTGDGSVEVDVSPGSRMASAWHVNTGDGHVTLRLPPNFAADIDAHTGDGHITADLPLTVSGTQRKSELRGHLNGGGEPLVVRTNDGHIRLERL
jgi:DUF4097 and DUF4098 domain-containing protein YvlB